MLESSGDLPAITEPTAFTAFSRLDRDDLLVDPRFPDYPATDRTDRFMVVEVIISSGRHDKGNRRRYCGRSGQTFGERLHLAPQDILFVFHEVEPNLPRFPAASIRPCG